MYLMHDVMTTRVGFAYPYLCVLCLIELHAGVPMLIVDFLTRRLMNKCVYNNS